MRDVGLDSSTMWYVPELQWLEVEEKKNSSVKVRVRDSRVMYSAALRYRTALMARKHDWKGK